MERRKFVSKILGAAVIGLAPLGVFRALLNRSTLSIVDVDIDFSALQPQAQSFYSLESSLFDKEKVYAIENQMRTSGELVHKEVTHRATSLSVRYFFRSEQSGHWFRRQLEVLNVADHRRLEQLKIKVTDEKRFS